MAIGFDGIHSYVDTAALENRSGVGLSNKLGQTSDASSDDELKEVCREFESYFMEQVYKGMLKTIGKEEDGDASLSNLVDYFKDSAVQTIASQTTEQSGGVLAQQLYEQMKRNYGMYT